MVSSRRAQRFHDRTHHWRHQNRLPVFHRNPEEIHDEVSGRSEVVAARDDVGAPPCPSLASWVLQVAHRQQVLMIEADEGHAVPPCPPGGERFEIRNHEIGAERVEDRAVEFKVRSSVPKDLRQVRREGLNGKEVPIPIHETQTRDLVDLVGEVFSQVGERLAGSGKNNVVPPVDQVLTDYVGPAAVSESFARHAVEDSGHSVSLSTRHTGVVGLWPGRTPIEDRDVPVGGDPQEVAVGAGPGTAVEIPVFEGPCPMRVAHDGHVVQVFGSILSIPFEHATGTDMAAQSRHGFGRHPVVAVPQGAIHPSGESVP